MTQADISVYQLLASAVARFCLVLCLSSLLLLPGPATADLDSAVRAYEKGDFYTALHEFTKLAHADDAHAQYNLAFMYYGGEGVVKDHTKAFHWFERAAKSGHKQAQDILGYMYNHGYGVQANRVRAYAWYSMAAKNGIFLAAKIRDSLALEMGKTERIQADLLIEDYQTRYGHTSAR